MSQTDLLLSEGIQKFEMAQSFEENNGRRKRIAELINTAWEIIHNDPASDVEKDL